MRGLRKYLTPFAPDQSGAVSASVYQLHLLRAADDDSGFTALRQRAYQHEGVSDVSGLCGGI